jgi:hypothetical protein
VTCRSSARQTARAYSSIRPPRTGFRRIFCVSMSVMVARRASGSSSGSPAPCHGGRRAGHRHRSSVRVLPAVVLLGRRRAGRLRPGRAGAGHARAPRRPQAHRRDPHLGRVAAGSRSRTPPRQPGRAHPRRIRGARAPPVSRARAGPPPGASLQKPLTCPPTRTGRRSTRPCPRDLDLAPRLLTRAYTAHVRLPAGQHHTLTMPIPPTAAQLRKTPPPPSPPSTSYSITTPTPRSPASSTPAA